MYDKLLFERSQTYSHTLLQYAKETRKEGFFNDVIVVTGKRSIPASRMVLACNSKYFECMFKTNMKERYSSTVKVQGAEDAAIQAIIEYFYEETIEINNHTVWDLLRASDYLQVDDVKEFCFEFLESNASVENAIHILTAADVYGKDCLSEQTYKFIRDNLEAITQTNDFLSLPKMELKLCLSKLNNQKVKSSASF